MLQISVQPKLRGNLFGMCGNFNGNPDDDFTTAQYKQSNLTDFTQSWRIGDKAQCTLRPAKVTLGPGIFN